MNIKKNINLILISFSSLFLFIFSVLFFQNVNVATSLNTVNTNFIWQFFLGISNLGIDISVILLGYYLSHFKTSLSTVIKSWITIWFSSLIILLIKLFANKSFVLSDFYNALFPILRNTYPILTGILFGIILMPLLKKCAAKIHLFYLPALIILTILPTVFNEKILGTNDIDSTVYGLLLICWGIEINNLKDKKIDRKNIIQGAFIIIFNELIITIMPALSWSQHFNLSTADRFSVSNSGFQILTACIVVTILSHSLLKNLKKYSDTVIYFIILTIICGTSDIFKGIISNYNNSTYNKVIHKVLIPNLEQTLLIILGCFVIACIIYLLEKLSRITLTIDKHWNNYNIYNIQEWGPNKYQNFKLWIKNHRLYLIGILCAYILSYISFVAVSDNFKVHSNLTILYNVFTYTFGPRQMLVILNTLVVIGVFRFIFALTNRFWISSISVGIIYIIGIIASYLKIQSRNEPIIPSDLSELVAINELLKMINFKLIIITVIGIIIAIGSIIYLERKKKVSGKSLKNRIFWILLIPILFLSVNFLNVKNNPISIISKGLGNEPVFEDQWTGVMKNGPIIQFLNNIGITIMDKPHGYSKEEMQKLYSKYSQEAKEINKQRNNSFKDQIVIFNLSESFADPTRLSGVTFSKDPIPNIRNIKKNNTSGLMLSSTYGGGTANIEYMTLTGLATCNFSPMLSTPYTQLVDRLKVVPSFIQSFPESIAIHPYLGTFYSRKEVYKKMGFDRFYYLGSKYKIIDQKKIDNSPYLSDETAYANALAQIKKAKSGLFINLITMQNHMPYDKKVYNNSEKMGASGSNVNSDMQFSLNNFAYGINKTDDAVQQFMNELDQIQKPVTWVFYGDHLPGIYTNANLQKDSLALHETDYFIYSNKYAQEHLGAKRLTKANIVTPNDFQAMVAEQTNTKVTPYQALLTEVYDKLPSFSVKTTSSDNEDDLVQFTTDDGKIIPYSDLTDEQKEIWHDYLLFQYDICAGKQYTVKMGLKD